MYKKTLSMLLCGVMLLSLGVCPAAADEAATSFTPGVYTSTANGNNGPLTVEVIFGANTIDAVTVTEHVETAGIADGALESIPTAIVEKQSLAIDTVTGATVTSNAILIAAEDAAVQAGADINLLKTAQEEQGEMMTKELSCDIVVVGAGAAGTAAAISALEQGANVILLEKTGSPMGASTLAGGLFAADSAQQKATDQVVSKQWLYNEYMELSGGYINSLLVRNVIDASGETVDWLNENGCITALVDAGTGGSYAHIGMPSTLHGYQEGGTVALTKLTESFTQKGGKIYFSTPATSLIYDEAGQVAGVTAQGADAVLNIKAKTVILATGGFGGNAEMMAQYIGEPFTFGEIAHNTGDGIKMAWEAGAAKEGTNVTQYFWQTFSAEEVGKMFEILGWDYFALTAFTGYPNLRVNLDGKRFSDETLATLYAVHGAQIQMQPQQTEFVIVDSAMLDTIKEVGTAGIEDHYVKWQDDPQFYMEFNEPNSTEAFYAQDHTPMDFVPLFDALLDTGVVYKGDSLDELAASMGVDADAFRASVDQYNGAIASGEDTLFFTDTSRMLSVEQGPFYAIKFSARNLGTLGGVRVNEFLQAIDVEGKVIPNLYVAGSDAGGMYGKSYVDFEGGTLGFAYISGRIAGLTAGSALAK